MRRMLMVLAVLAVTLPLPVQAFDEPLPLPEVTIWTVAHWRAAWALRASDALDLGLLGEWRWMRDTYFPGPEPRSQPTTTKRPLPAPAPVAVAQTYGPGVEQWRALVAFFWPPEHIDRMLRIMACESGGDPYADNPRSTALGLFQIMGGWQATWPGDYTDPWTNAAVAYQIWLTQGYGAWVCRG